MNKRRNNYNKDNKDNKDNRKKRKITITPPEKKNEKKNENNDIDKFYTLLFHSLGGSNENYEKDCKKMNECGGFFASGIKYKYSPNLKPFN